MSKRKYYFDAISFAEACQFVTKYHRHNAKPQGHKYSICLRSKIDDTLIGVAIVGRPISRYLDDKKSLEITRLCIKEYNKNACSMLYSRAVKIAKLLGYTRVITYTLEKEKGISLIASGFEFDGKTKYTKGWQYRNGKQLTLFNEDILPTGDKNRWLIQ